MIISNGRHRSCRLDRCYEYVNGEIGTIVAYNPERKEIQLKMSDGRLVTVKKAVWTNTEYALDYDENGKKMIVSREIGCFKQYPILPAWATSIHKAQGQTLDCQVHIHLGKNDCFTSEQLYTALSRVYCQEEFKRGKRNGLHNSGVCVNYIKEKIIRNLNCISTELQRKRQRSPHRAPV